MATRRKSSASRRTSRRERLPSKIVVGTGHTQTAFIRHASEPDEAVYRLEASGLPAVATGRVFLRFTKGVDVSSREQEIASAGFKIVQMLPHARHAAWVEPETGSVADALTHLGDLQSLKDVENVEPQMLMERAKR